MQKIILWFKNLFIKNKTASSSPAESPTAGGSDHANSDMPWMKIAEAELGQKEVSGSKDNKRIVEYHAATTLHASHDEIAWCAAFVCWVLKSSGFKHTASASARSYLNYGDKLHDPKIGCIVVLDRGHGMGHVAFCAGFTSDSLKLLGGNQSDSVCYKWTDKDKVLGYRWPVK